MEIKLPSGRTIGPGHPPFIIAEVGSNWRTFDDCLDSIVKAKQCGADAVKFQLLDEKALYGIDVDAVRLEEYRRSTGGYVFATVNSEDMRAIREMAKLKDWLPKLKEKADAVGIEFMCTAFSPDLYDIVNPFVNIHKVASAECTHLRILEKLRSYGKPVILSTGAKGEADIRAALDVLRPTYDHHAMKELEPTLQVILMYCVAAYPANEVNLDVIREMAARFGVDIGYSDHTIDVYEIPMGAIRSGAVLIEKHFSAIEAPTPDRPHSLLPDQFRNMVRAIHSERVTKIGPTEAEKHMILRHNRRLIATRDIKAGDLLLEVGTSNKDSAENFGIFRSLKDDTHALHPFAVNQVNGKRATKEIAAGDGIGPGDFE